VVPVFVEVPDRLAGAGEHEHAEPDRVGVQEEEQRGPCGSGVVAQHPAGKPMDGQDGEEGDDEDSTRRRGSANPTSRPHHAYNANASGGASSPGYLRSVSKSMSWPNLWTVWR
jgi:hypothetical protein